MKSPIHLHCWNKVGRMYVCLIPACTATRYSRYLQNKLASCARCQKEFIITDINLQLQCCIDCRENVSEHEKTSAAELYNYHLEQMRREEEIRQQRIQARIEEEAENRRRRAAMVAEEKQRVQVQREEEIRFRKALQAQRRQEIAEELSLRRAARQKQKEEERIEKERIRTEKEAQRELAAKLRDMPDVTNILKGAFGEKEELL